MRTDISTATIVKLWNAVKISDNSFVASRLFATLLACPSQELCTAEVRAAIRELPADSIADIVSLSHVAAALQTDPSSSQYEQVVDNLRRQRRA